MATAKKKTTTTKTTTKAKASPKKKKEWAYVGVNYEGMVYASHGPIQIIDEEYLIFPAKEPNNWSSDATSAKATTAYISELDNYEGNAFVTTLKEFRELYPGFAFKDDDDTKKKVTAKQINFCL